MSHLHILIPIYYVQHHKNIFNFASIKLKLKHISEKILSRKPLPITKVVKYLIIQIV